MYEHIFHISVFVINAYSISVKYYERNREILYKMLGMLLRTDSVWEREILGYNLLFILI